MTPDPASLVHHDVLPDGTRVLMRPLRPEDAALYPEFIAHVTLEDSRLRFFSSIKELSEERIAQLTRLDYSRAMAFIALDEAAARMLGVVRLHLDDDRAGGEYAVIVRSELKGHGLGWLLMQRMIDYARALGLKRVYGQVLAENTTMLRMCAELGFHIEDDPHQRGIRLVTLQLT
ncbi:MAG: GNAT family N-acetyltransferase [Alphaproteobacteria bacterium]|nr:MAG: GNAT family N-acetyltransferase [Alphaproteobacteria bacterium]